MGTINTKTQPAISAGTITRTILLVLALVNHVLVTMGKAPLPIVDETVTQLVAMLVTTGAALLAWWKNNSFTPAALAGDERMNEMRKNG